MPNTVEAVRWVIAGPQNTFYVGTWNTWKRPHMAGIERAVMYNSEAEALAMHERFAQRTTDMQSKVIAVQINYMLDTEIPETIEGISEEAISCIVGVEKLVDTIVVDTSVNPVIPALLSQTKSILASARQSLYAAIEISAKTQE